MISAMNEDEFILKIHIISIFWSLFRTFSRSKSSVILLISRSKKKYVWIEMENLSLSGTFNFIFQIQYLHGIYIYCLYRCRCRYRYRLRINYNNNNNRMEWNELRPFDFCLCILQFSILKLLKVFTFQGWNYKIVYFICWDILASYNNNKRNAMTVYPMDFRFNKWKQRLKRISKVNWWWLQMHKFCIPSMALQAKQQKFVSRWKT